MCTLEDAMVVTPFPQPSSSSSSSFTYRGSCEHTVLSSCGLTDTFAITVDFLAADLSLGRVGVRLGGSQKLVIHEDLFVDAQGLGNPMLVEDGVEEFNGSIRVTRALSNVTVHLLELGIVVSVARDGHENQTGSLMVDASRYNRTRGEICGLCGNLTGHLIHSDAVTVVRERVRERLQEFARSWQVNPGEQILRQESRRCGEPN